MKNFLIPALAVLTLLSGCEQVIDYELEEGAKKLVVEGLVTDQPGPYTVRLTETKGYLDQAPNPAIMGATVIIQDNQGHIDTLQPVGPGNYQTTTLQGQPGNTYFLRVLHNGKEYNAQSTMRPMNPIDSISYVFKPYAGDRPEGYYSTFYFQERPGRGDNYRFDFFINSRKMPEITAINDDLYEGNYGDPEIEYTLELNDTIRVEMYSLDKPGLDFWNALMILFYQQGSPFDTPPANAPGNISNGALGYFGASVKSSATAVIQ